MTYEGNNEKLDDIVLMTDDYNGQTVIDSTVAEVDLRGSTDADCLLDSSKDATENNRKERRETSQQVKKCMRNALRKNETGTLKAGKKGEGKGSG